MISNQRSRLRQRTAVTVLFGLWGVSPVACGGRSSTLDGDDSSQGGLGATSGGADSFGGGPIGPGGFPGFGGAPTVRGGAPNTAGGFGNGGRFSSGGARTSGGAFTTGGSLPVTGGKSGRGGAGGKGNSGGNGGSGGWDGGAAGGGFAGWDGGGAGGTGGETCAENAGLVVYVDPLEGNDADVGDIRPTGVLNPPQCRYRTLTRALGSVKTRGQVVAVNDGPTTLSFRNESFPLVVPPLVTLTGSRDDPSRYQIPYTSSFNTAVVLQQGATFEGFTVHNRTGGAGTFVACSGQASAALNDVVLSGDDKIVTAVQLGCAADVSNLTISGTAVGLDIAGSAGATITGASISNCSVGIHVAGSLVGGNLDIRDNGDAMVVDSGDVYVWESWIGQSSPTRAISPRGNGVVMSGGNVSFTNTAISYNAGAGVYMDGGSLMLFEGDVFSNGVGPFPNDVRPTGSGVYVQRAESVTVTTSRLTENSVHGLHLISSAVAGSVLLDNARLQQNRQNGAQLDGQIRTSFSSTNSTFVDNSGSGLVFNRAVPVDALYGNWFVTNLASQLVFNVPSLTGTWLLGASSVGCVEPNTVACYIGGALGVVAAQGVAVDAGFMRWHNIPPIAGQDFVGPVTVHDTCGTGSTRCGF